jgi:hypothetical protein
MGPEDRPSAGSIPARSRRRRHRPRARFRPAVEQLEQLWLLTTTTLTWLGGGDNANWDTPGNWQDAQGNPVNLTAATAPAPAQLDLVFDNTGITNQAVPVNDITGLAVDKITISNTIYNTTSGAGPEGYHVTGAMITLGAGGIDVTTPLTALISLGIHSPGETSAESGDITESGGGELIFDAQDTGYNDPDPNDTTFYRGALRVTSGKIGIGNSTGLKKRLTLAANTPLTIGDPGTPIIGDPDAPMTPMPVTFQAESISEDDNSTSATITPTEGSSLLLTDGSDGGTFDLPIYPGPDPADAQAAQVEIDGSVSGSNFNLSNGSTVQIGNAQDPGLMTASNIGPMNPRQGDTYDITVYGSPGSGSFDLSGQSTLTVEDPSAATFSGVLSSDRPGQGTFVEDGSDVLTLDSASPDFTGQVEVNAGGLRVGAGGSIEKISSLAVNGGTFDVATSQTVLDSATATFASGSTFAVSIGQAASGALIDNSVIPGLVGSAAPIALDPGGGTNLAVTVDPSLAAGTPVTILQASAITGQFAGHPDGSTFTADGVPLLIHYTGTAVTLTRQVAPTSTVVSSSANPSVYGQSVTFTANTTSTAGTVSGTVTFFDHGSELGTGTLSGGVASYSTAALSVGSHAITATYAATTNFATSTGTLSGGQTVNQAQTRTTINTPIASTVYGQPESMSATVNVASPGAGTPTGSVDFQKTGPGTGGATTDLGHASVGAGGVATLTSPVVLTAGSYTVTASYSGDPNFAGSTSPSATETISPPTNTPSPTTTSVQSSNLRPGVGVSVTITATVTASTPGVSPPGSVQFLIDGSLKATVLLASGSASTQYQFNAPGNHTVTAQYVSSDAGFSNSIGALSPPESVHLENRPLDYTGDGKADLTLVNVVPFFGVFWLIRDSASLGLVTPIPNFGNPSLPAIRYVSGDYDGDGKADLALYYPNGPNGQALWIIRDSSNPNGPPDVRLFGPAGTNWIPVPGDYDGDGKTDLALFNPNAGNGLAAWIIRDSSNPYHLDIRYFGLTSLPWQPVPADYDGDGKTDLALYDPNGPNGQAEWVILDSSTGTVETRLFGQAGSAWQPVPADYTGDGKADLAIFNSSAGVWIIQDSSNPNSTPQVIQFGAPGLRPALASIGAKPANPPVSPVPLAVSVPSAGSVSVGASALVSPSPSATAPGPRAVLLAGVRSKVVTGQGGGPSTEGSEP